MTYKFKSEQNQQPASVKAGWVRPAVQRLEAGAAESGEGGINDNSAPQKS